VPQGAGVGSAIGFLRAPVSFEATRSVFTAMDDFGPAAVRALLSEMEQHAAGFVRACDASAEIVTEHNVYMRYAGQGWEIPVVLMPAPAAAPVADAVLARFAAEYEKLFGRTVAGLRAEITVWSVRAATRVTAPPPVEPVPDGPEPTGAGRRDLVDPARAAMVSAVVQPRTGLAHGGAVPGPALITEDETTIVVPAGRRARVLGDGTVEVVAPEGTG
jgi:N-methylhydantoinase A